MPTRHGAVNGAREALREPILMSVYRHQKIAGQGLTFARHSGGVVRVEDVGEEAADAAVPQGDCHAERYEDDA